MGKSGTIAIVEVDSSHRFEIEDRGHPWHVFCLQRPYGDNDSATELYLENGVMDKQSYVALEHIFQVPASQLRSCSFRSGSRAYDSRLCEQSYTLLMARLGLEPEIGSILFFWNLA